jgi:membrane protease YdiL (CAAX protease family)
VVLFAGAYAFTKLVAPVGSPRESWLARLYLQLGHPGELRANVKTMVLGIVVAAAAEEIVWRGLVTTLLAEQFGSRRAWIYSAVAYAAAHVPTIWALRDPVAGMNPVLVMAALAAGLVWGAMARMFGRLPPAILSHALFDWMVVMMFRLWGPSV